MKGTNVQQSRIFRFKRSVEMSEKISFIFNPSFFYSLSSSSSRWSYTRSLHSGLTARNVVFRVATSEHCVERRCNNEVKFLLLFGSAHIEYLRLTLTLKFDISEIYVVWVKHERAAAVQIIVQHFYIHFKLLNWSKRHLSTMRSEMR